MAAIFVVLSQPSNALACACCAEPGTYGISTKTPGTSESEELKRLRFGDSTDLFMTDAGEDDVKGIDPVSFNYQVTSIFQNKTWKFTFKDNEGKSGTLTLPLTGQMVDFMVDIHDGKQGGAGGPLLYKEWRFKAKVSAGTGIFKKGIALATDFFLVFQGRGNFCTSAETFTNWRLEISGKKAKYAFYGDLKPLS
jgi:hypothetical protein